MTCVPGGGGPRAPGGAGVRIVLRIPPSWAVETSIATGCSAGVVIL